MTALSIQNMNVTLGKRELEQTVSFTARWNVAVEMVRDYFGDEQAFVAWWDSYPETMSREEFLPIIEAKVIELGRAKLASRSCTNNLPEGCKTDVTAEPIPLSA